MPEPIDVNILNLPEIMRHLFESAEMTKVEAAKISGVHVNSIFCWQRGERSPRFDQLCFVLDALGKKMVITDK